MFNNRFKITPICCGSIIFLIKYCACLGFGIQSSGMISVTKTQITSGAKLLVDLLTAHGVNTIFGYPGAAVLPVYDELSKQNRIKHYLCRHEQAAVHAADGYARVSRKPGVVLVTSGPGATNTVTGILNANSDNVPLIVIAGQCEELGCNNFQEADMSSIVSSCTKKTFLIKSEEEIFSVISQAFETAIKPPMGSVVVSVLKSVLVKTFEYSMPEDKYIPNFNVGVKQSEIFHLLDILKSAKRPSILVGGGAYEAVSMIREFVHMSNIPVVHTLMGKGIVDELSLGMIGVNGSNLANSVIEDTDVLMVLGARLDSRITGITEKYLPQTKIININLEKNTTSNVDMYQEIIGDLKIVLQQILDKIKSENIMLHQKYDWIDKIDYLKNLYSKENHSFVSSNSEGLVTEKVLNIIYNHTKKYNPIVTTDVGQHQILASKIFESKTPYNFLTSGGLGAMGFGFPAAIGAHIAKPDSLILNITGDGSFQMNMQELGTCLEYKIPVKIIVMNNSSLGLIKQSQAKYYGNRFYQSDMINPDFVKIASAYGIQGVSITTSDELEQALNKYIISDAPVLFDIHTIGAELV